MQTFGCQMNANDSVWLAQALKARGFHEAQAPEDAQVFLLNTCSVREKPELKVYSQLGRIREFCDKDPSAFAVVGGCVAQQLGAALWNRFPFVRLVFGTDGVSMAPQAIERLCREPRLRLSLLDFSERYPERERQDSRFTPGQAFVNIMQGCDNFCAYCIVPFTRGRQKSRASEAVLDECRELARLGARELCLLGQNVNSYGRTPRATEPASPSCCDTSRPSRAWSGCVSPPPTPRTSPTRWWRPLARSRPSARVCTCRSSPARTGCCGPWADATTARSIWTSSGDCDWPGQTSS